MTAATTTGHAISRLSPSALERYLRCPKQFRLMDVDRAARGREGSPVLTQANAVHHALERFFGLPVGDREPAHLERALRAVWPEHRRRDTFSSREEEGEFGRGALEMLARFGTAHDLGVQPLAREQWVRFRIAGVQLIGKLDRIDPGRQGGIDVVDYKTGRRALEPSDLPAEPAVQVYVLGAEATCRLPVERVRFVYVALGSEVIWEPEREGVTNLAERLTKTIEMIREDDTFAATPGHHCRFCPFSAVCPERSATTLDDIQPVEELPF